VLLLSTYDLGRQPFGLASAAAWLKREGIDVRPIDLSREQLQRDDLSRVDLVAFYLPMHTATRLALPVIDRIRTVEPEVMICAYGLYAPLNEALLRERGVSVVLGPEAEADLVALAREVRAGDAGEAGPPTRLRGRHGEVAPELASEPMRAKADGTGREIPRLQFIVPNRSDLLPLTRYASLEMPDGTRRIVGSTDATRGCKHRCRHCPIVPVYDGQFRVVPVEVVRADVRAQVEQGAQHITFADPDFFNGPTHAHRIVDAVHAEFPELTYDVTIKVEHLLAHRHLLPVLARTGCLFVTSAVESVDDGVLEHLEKGHTRADFIEAAGLCREAGLTLAPTFVAFTPWTTLEGYSDLVELVDTLGLAGHVAPVQWGIRLLVTWRSRLLELPDIQRLVGPFDRHTLTYPWRHPDPAVDALQEQVMNLVGVRINRPRFEIFNEIRALATSTVGTLSTLGTPGTLGTSGTLTTFGPLISRSAIPYLNEPWYC
jgi:radical SAM superfamily enzyme YgiQ (UPF0313 family)